MARIKSWIIPSVRQIIEKLESLIYCCWSVQWCSHCGKWTGRSSKGCHVPRQVYCIHKRNNTHPHRNLHMNVCSSITHKSQRTETMWMCINKMWYICTIEYYSAVRMKWSIGYILTVLMNLDNTVLSERRQSPKPTYSVIAFICLSW